MTDTMDKTDIRAWVAPTEADIAEWNRLSRDEQLRALRDHVTHPDAGAKGAVTMDDIWVDVRARRLARQPKHV